MKERKGLTLIEIIISIAILLIMTVMILGIFNISITSIFKSGKRTDQVLKAKQYVDEQIKINQDNIEFKNEVIIEIGDFSVEIEGNIIDTGSKFDMLIRTFVPVKIAE